MDRETFIKGLKITLEKTNMPNGNGINLESICKDFALLAYDEALILHSVVGQSEQLKCECKRATFTREVDADFNFICGKCGRTL